MKSIKEKKIVIHPWSKMDFVTFKRSIKTHPQMGVYKGDLLRAYRSAMGW